MTELTYTEENVEIIQNFLDETKTRLSLGVEVTYTKKAYKELKDLSLEYDIDLNDITTAIVNLEIGNYYQGTELSFNSDFDICAFNTNVSDNNINIYLKYGLSKEGSTILVFSNHEPNHPMTTPFKI